MQFSSLPTLFARTFLRFCRFNCAHATIATLADEIPGLLTYEFFLCGDDKMLLFDAATTTTSFYMYNVHTMRLIH